MGKFTLMMVCSQIARRYRVHILFDVDIEEGTSGWANPVMGIISVSTKFDEEVVASTFFHELSHVLDFREGIYFYYYKAVFAPFTMIVDNRYELINRYALDAERHADLRAEQLMKEYMPTWIFEPAYQTEKDIRWLQDRAARRLVSDTK